MAERSTFFTDMTQFVTVNMGTNLFESAGNLISNIAPIFSTLFGLYLLLIAFSYWQGGGIDEMAIDFFKRLMVWALLIGLAFSAGNYHELANVIYGLPDDIAKAFGNIDYSGGALDKIVDDVNTLTDNLEEHRLAVSTLDVDIKLAYLVTIWAVEIFMGILLAVMFAFYVLGKVSLAMVLMIGRIFIGFGLFPATRQYAMNWIGQCLNYVFMIVLLSILGSMKLAFISSYVDIMGADNLVAAGNLAILLLLALLVFVVVCWNIPQIASALTGGGAIQGSMRTVYNMARGGLRKAGNTTEKGVNKVRSRFGKSGGGNIKKT